MQSISAIVLVAVAAATSYALSIAYRAVWNRRRPDSTPTGFGGLLALYMLAAAALAGAPALVIAACGVVAAAAAVYWLDDAAGLPVRLRFAIQFGAGVAIGCLVLYPIYGPTAPLLGLSIAAGGLNIVLTNIVNFYDGADLNLATLMGLGAICGLLFAARDPLLVATAVMLLAFVVPFAWVNRKPRSLYLGDSGSFAFACLLTVAAMRYLASNGDIHPLIAAPLALPAMDVAFVFLLRIARREDLLSRNFHHLYQRLQAEKPGFAYLIPQFVSVALIMGMAAVLGLFGLHRFWAAAAAMAGVTPVLYLLSRRLFLRSPWLG